MKNCPYCGGMNEDKAVVCTKCCAALKEEKEPVKVSKKEKELIEDGTGT